MTVNIEDLTPFDIPPDWTNGIPETRSWLTNVLQGYDNSEQRIQLRRRERAVITFDMMTVEIEEFEYLRNLLWVTQANYYAVPLWMDGVRLESVITPGDTAITVDTSFARFADLEGIMITRGVRETELRRIHDVGDGVLNLSSPVEGSFDPADGETWVIPFLIGRLTDKVDHAITASRVQSGKLDFTCEYITLLEEGS